MVGTGQSWAPVELKNGDQLLPEQGTGNLPATTARWQAGALVSSEVRQMAILSVGVRICGWYALNLPGMTGPFFVATCTPGPCRCSYYPTPAWGRKRMPGYCVSSLRIQPRVYPRTANNWVRCALLRHARGKLLSCEVTFC